MSYDHGGSSDSSGGAFPSEASLPVVIATILRGDGITGVGTHIRQLRRHLRECGAASTLVTPFSWGRALTVGVFGFRASDPGGAPQTGDGSIALASFDGTRLYVGGASEGVPKLRQRCGRRC